MAICLHSDRSGTFYFQRQFSPCLCTKCDIMQSNLPVNLTHCHVVIAFSSILMHSHLGLVVATPHCQHSRQWHQSQSPIWPFRCPSHRAKSHCRFSPGNSAHLACNWKIDDMKSESNAFSHWCLIVWLIALSFSVSKHSNWCTSKVYWKNYCRVSSLSNRITGQLA